MFPLPKKCITHVLVPHDFSDAALVVLGHGSTKNAGSAAPVFQHAAELRRRKLFAEVREAFWKQEPKIGDVLQSISASRTFIVPLFISECYFSEEVIPKALGFTSPTIRLHASRITHHAPCFSAARSAPTTA